MNFSISRKYLLITAIIFLIEVFIAAFVRDALIRPFVGDVLVVILVYCFLRIFLKGRTWKIALGVLLFACVIEILQYFDYVKRLGLENNRVLSMAMGRTFELTDFAAYLAGFLLIIFTEKFYDRHPDNQSRRRIKR